MPISSALLIREADMILRAADEAVPEPLDRGDVQVAYDRVVNEITARVVPPPGPSRWAR